MSALRLPCFYVVAELHAPCHVKEGETYVRPQGPPAPMIIEADSPCSFEDAVKRAREADELFFVYEIDVKAGGKGTAVDVTEFVLGKIASESIARQRLLGEPQAEMCDALGIQFYDEDMIEADEREDRAYRRSVRFDYAHGVL